LTAARIVPICGICEPFSSLSHLAGAGLFAVLAPALIRRGRGCRYRVTALSVFALSCALLLAVSGVYHLLAFETPARLVLQRLDHAAIFVLIAGTFTAAHAILFRGVWRWGMIALIWLLAGAGVVLKLAFFERVSEAVGLAFYLGMGWIGLVSGYRVWRLYGGLLMRPLLGGGVAYTVGALLEFCRWPELAPGLLGPHELFHLCVLIGVACHWEFVQRFAHGELSPSRGPLAVGG
jgi:channel protein (hemolysin III family)